MKLDAMKLDAEKWREWDRKLARLLEADTWKPEPTLLGGLHGEIELEAVGAVPAVELD
jgi:hypothetical protein